MSSSTSSGAWKDVRGGSPERRAPGGLGKAVTSVVEPAPTPAERHLGDRLAALIDGELGHDTRERVLAHLATCDQCRVEADEQRRLKTVFAAAAPPPPSAGLLARLQGLPAVDGDDASGGFGGGLGSGLTAFLAQEPGPMDPGSPSGDGGQSTTDFRIHEFSKPSRPSAPAHRGRRFAFAAAGAFSLAALALSGALPMDGVPEPGRPEEPGSTVTPMVGQAETAGADSTRGRAPSTLNVPVSALVPVHQPLRGAPSTGLLPSVTPPAGPSLLRGSGPGSPGR